MSSVAPRTFTESQLGRWLFKSARIYLGVVARYLSHLEIERYSSIIVLLKESCRPMKQQEWADFPGIYTAAVVRLLGYLTKRRFMRGK